MNEFVYVYGKNQDRNIRMDCRGVTPGAENELFSEVVFTGKALNFPSIKQHVRLYHKVKRIEFENGLVKDETLEKEGVYFAFPFNVPGGGLRLDMTGGMMAVEKDQMPSGMRDWISMQDAAGAVGDKMSVLFSTPDAPLAVPEEIKVMTFRDKLPLRNTTLFSYIMNNYWHTNYKASQGGDFTFRYAITSAAGKASDTEIAGFGREFADPLQTIWVEKGGAGGGGKVGFLSVGPANVRLLGVKTAEDGVGIILRLQEIDGKSTTAKIEVSPLIKASESYRTNLLEEGGVKLRTKRAPGGGLLIEDTIRSRGLLTIRVR